MTRRTVAAPSSASTSARARSRSWSPTSTGDLIGQADGGYPVSSPRPGGRRPTRRSGGRHRRRGAGRPSHGRRRRRPRHRPVRADARRRRHRRDGSPVRAAMLWSDARATDQLARTRAFRPRYAPGWPTRSAPGWPARCWRGSPARARGVRAATRWALSPKDWLRVPAHRRVRHRAQRRLGDAPVRRRGRRVGPRGRRRLGLDAGEAAAGAPGSAAAGRTRSPRRRRTPRPAPGHPGRRRRRRHRGRRARLRPRRARHRPADHRHRRAAGPPDRRRSRGPAAGSRDAPLPQRDRHRLVRHGRRASTAARRWPGCAGCSAPPGRSCTLRRPCPPARTTRSSCPTCTASARPTSIPGCAARGRASTPRTGARTCCARRSKGSRSPYVRPRLPPASGPTSPSCGWPAAARPHLAWRQMLADVLEHPLSRSTFPPPPRSAPRFSPARRPVSRSLPGARTAQVQPSTARGPADPASIGGVRALSSTSRRCGSPRRRRSPVRSPASTAPTALTQPPEPSVRPLSPSRQSISAREDRSRDATHHTAPVRRPRTRGARPRR